jgi:hypothetical protein
MLYVGASPVLMVYSFAKLIGTGPPIAGDFCHRLAPVR